MENELIKFLEMCFERGQSLTVAILVNNMPTLRKTAFKIQRNPEVELVLQLEAQKRFHEAYKRLSCMEFEKGCVMCMCCDKVVQYIRLRNYIRCLEEKKTVLDVELEHLQEDDDDYFMRYLIGKHVGDPEILFNCWKHFPYFYECIIDTAMTISSSSLCGSLVAKHREFLSTAQLAPLFVYILYIERSLTVFPSPPDQQNMISEQNKVFEKKIMSSSFEPEDSPDFSLAYETYHWLIDESNVFETPFDFDRLVDVSYLSFYALFLYKEKKIEHLTEISSKSLLISAIAHAAREEYTEAIKLFDTHLGEGSLRIRSYVYTWYAKMAEFTNNFSLAQAYLDMVDITQSNPMLSCIMTYYSMGFYTEALFFALDQLGRDPHANKRILYKYVGRIYLKFCDFNSAETFLMKSIECGEKDSYLYLAEVYKRNEKSDKIISCYETYLKIRDLPRKNRDRILRYLIQHFEEMEDDVSALKYTRELQPLD